MCGPCLVAAASPLIGGTSLIALLTSKNMLILSFIIGLVIVFYLYVKDCKTCKNNKNLK